MASMCCADLKRQQIHFVVDSLLNGQPVRRAHHRGWNWIYHLGTCSTTRAVLFCTMIQAADDDVGHRAAVDRELQMSKHRCSDAFIDAQV